MINILYLRIILLLLAAGIAAYTDYKTGYIYDWVSLTLIGAGLIINFFTFPLKQYFIIIGITLAIYVVGLIFYKMGKIGGGDVKLFMGINLILPYYKGEIFFLWVLIFASLLSVMIVSLNYIYKLFKKKIVTKKILLEKKGLIARSLALFLFYLFFVYFAVEIRNMTAWIYLSLLPILFGSVIIVFEKEIRENIYLRNKPIDKLEEGDVLALEMVPKKILEKLGFEKTNVLEKEEIEKIKKLQKELEIGDLPIYDNLPKFGPYILLGIIVVLGIGFLI